MGKRRSFNGKAMEFGLGYEVEVSTSGGLKTGVEIGKGGVRGYMTSKVGESKEGELNNKVHNIRGNGSGGEEREG